MKNRRSLILGIILFFSITFIYAQNNSIDSKQLEEKSKGVFYLNGILYSGKCYSKTYISGIKVTDGYYKNGLKDSIWVWYYENGAKKRETHYKCGKMQGISTIWYKDGQKRSEINYDDNECLKKIKTEYGQKCPNCKDYTNSYKVYFVNTCKDTLSILIAVPNRNKTYKIFEKDNCIPKDTVIAFSCDGMDKYYKCVKKKGTKKCEFKDIEQEMFMKFEH